MKKKFVFLSISCFLAISAVALSCIALSKNSEKFFSKAKGADEDFTFTINGGDVTKETEMADAHGNVDLVTDSTKALAPANQNFVKFNYDYAPYGKSGDIDYTYLTQNVGWISNDVDSPIRSMKSIDVKGYGNVAVYWGWLNELDEIEYYDSEILTINGSGDTTIFKGYTPNYFKIAATNYSTPGIRQIIITYDKDCVVADNPYFVDNGLKFLRYGEDEAICIGFSGEPVSEVVIPKTVKGLTVTQIGDSAFNDISAITDVTIPNTIEYIGDSAFYSCDYLDTVTFEPGGTETLVFGDNPFGGVTSLTGEFVIPKRAADGLTQYAFDDMKYISSYRFEDNYAGGEYTCVDGVIYHGNVLHTYPMASTRTSFTVPNTVTSFNEFVGISHNQYIETIIFENTSNLYLNSYCLGYNSSLTSVQFNGTAPVTLEWYVFSGDTQLSKIILPADTIVHGRAFSGLGNDGAHQFHVYFDGDDMTNWNTTESYNGPWYNDLGSYARVYLRSDASPIDKGDLPEHVYGSWRYVDSVPTGWEVTVRFKAPKTNIGEGYGLYLLGTMNYWTKSEDSRMTFDNSTGTWWIDIALVPGTQYEFKLHVAEWDPPYSTGTYEGGLDRKWTPDDYAYEFVCNWVEP